MTPSPPHAPYDVVVGHEVEVRVFRKEGTDDILVAECEVGGDKFGSETELTGDDLGDALAVDELVAGVGRLVYHELLGTPVFRDEDEEWVGRVAAQRPWEGETRSPTLGYAAMPRLPEPGPEQDSVARSLGDADVSNLHITQDEMASLTRGEVPDSLLERVLRERSTLNLIETAQAAVQTVLEHLPQDDSDQEILGRAYTELAEVLSRFE